MLFPVKMMKQQLFNHTMKKIYFTLLFFCISHCQLDAHKELDYCDLIPQLLNNESVIGLLGLKDSTNSYRTLVRITDAENILECASTYSKMNDKIYYSVTDRLTLNFNSGKYREIAVYSSLKDRNNNLISFYIYSPYCDNLMRHVYSVGVKFEELNGQLIILDWYYGEVDIN